MPEKSDQERLLAERTAAVQGSPVRSNGGMKPQQIAGGVLLVCGLIGGFLYLSAGEKVAPLQGAAPASFGAQNGGNAGTMTIGGYVDPTVTVAAPEPEIDAVPRPETAIETRDSDETLARLNELTAAQSEAQSLIAKLQVDLEAANDELVRSRTDMSSLTQSFALERTAFEGRLNNELTQKDLFYGNQITSLQAELQICRAGAGTNTNAGGPTDEQLARLEEARKRRQQQIESEALIFDNSTVRDPSIRY